MFTNARFVLIVGSLVRYLVTLLAGVLVANGALTDADRAEFIAGAVALIVPLAWSIYQKLRERAKFETALRLPPSETEADVKAKLALRGRPR